jgi:Peptidase A4 family
MEIRTRRLVGVLGALAIGVALGSAPAAQAAVRSTSQSSNAQHSTASAAVVTVPGFSTPGIVQPILGAATPNATTTNTHWSGYDATTGDYTSVAATFTQPTVNCSSGGDVVFWVGLGGGTATSESLQQNGTFAQCSGGTARYSAWWETWPCNSITNYGSTVKPGDVITMSTTNLGGNSYQFTVTDTTEGWSVSPKHTGCNGGSTATAEVITETPEIGGSLANLPNFGTVTYSAATINGSALSASAPMAINMARSGTTMDTTSAISSSGTSFSNTWVASS